MRNKTVPNTNVFEPSVTVKSLTVAEVFGQSNGDNSQARLTL